MTLAELRAKWSARAAEWAALGVMVNGPQVAANVLEDLAQLEHATADETLTLADAARESGYSGEHLRHLIASGQLANAGRKHAPRVRRSDLPRKPGTRTASHYNPDADALSLVGRRRPA